MKVVHVKPKKHIFIFIEKVSLYLPDDIIVLQ